MFDCRRDACHRLLRWHGSAGEEFYISASVSITPRRNPRLSRSLPSTLALLGLGLAGLGARKRQQVRSCRASMRPASEKTRQAGFSVPLNSIPIPHPVSRRPASARPARRVFIRTISPGTYEADTRPEHHQQSPHQQLSSRCTTRNTRLPRPRSRYNHRFLPGYPAPGRTRNKHTR